MCGETKVSSILQQPTRINSD